ncbi:cellulose binding domain-containing protein [Lentzea sp. NPDC051208]|uniref:cellulose binding domain-containing protein n=1 Tax=Lentzea sp. NPDC051208 TaxID=3154642 RepID=UPI00342B09A5
MIEQALNVGASLYVVQDCDAPRGPAPLPSSPAAAFSQDSSWGSGHQGKFTVSAGSTALSGWKLEFDLAGASVGSYWAHAQWNPRPTGNSRTCSRPARADSPLREEGRCGNFGSRNGLHTSEAVSKSCSIRSPDPCTRHSKNNHPR